MPTFHIVKGKKGVLVGDPQRNGFIGQRRLTFTAETAPKTPGERYEPCEMVCCSTPDLRKALKLKQVQSIRSFEARNMKAAVQQVPAAPKPKDPGGGNK